MKRWSWMAGAALMCALVGAAPAAAEDQTYYPPPAHYGHGPDMTFRLRLGLFTPSGDSDYWHGAEQEFTTKTSDFEDLVYGMDFIWNMHQPVGIMFSGDYYDGKNDMSYRDFVDTAGREIFHTTELDIAPLTAGIVVRLAPEGFPVKPYIGGGGGLYFWHLDETGDFIDFGGNRNIIFNDSFHDDGTTFGGYALVGLDVPIGTYFSVFGEARWDWAKDDLTGDFAGLGKLDLGGRRLTGGVAWHF